MAITKVVCVFCGLPIKKSDPHEVFQMRATVSQNGTKKTFPIKGAMAAHLSCRYPA